MSATNKIHDVSILCSYRFVSPLAGFIAAMGFTQTGYALEVKQKSLEEIVVTARKTEENLQSIPAAVSAFSSNTLRELQVENIGDMQSLVPNLSLHVGDASNAVIYIRGVGQIDALAFSDPGVGVYVDDVYLGRAQGSFLDVMDVERIEVLRGPQGTLYGRNTIGGAVKYVSAKPGNEFKAYVEGSAGNHDRLDFKTSVSGPIIPDVLSAGITVAQLTRDGFTDNAFDGKDDGDKDTQAWRGMLVWNPTDHFELQLTADSSDADPDRSRTPAKETACCTVSPTPSVAPDTDPFELNVSYNTVERTQSDGVALHLSWQVNEALSVKSITAYRELEYNGELDLDGTTFRIFDVFFNVDQDQTTQEFQLVYEQEAWRLVGGLYWFEEESESFDGIIGPEIGFVFAGLNENRSEGHALFGELSFNVTDDLRIAFGGRFSEEEKEFDRVADLLAGNTNTTQQDLLVAIGTGFNVSNLSDLDNDWENLSLRFTVDWQIAPEAMLYFSAAEGFKSGGFNGRSNDILDPTAADPFDEEEALLLEAGLKSEWLDRRLQLNLAVFHTDYEDLQVQFPTMAALPAFENVGEATIQGAELEFLYLVTDALKVNANLGYLDADIDEFIEDGVDVTDQRKMVNAPDWDGSIGFAYDLTLSFGVVRFASDYGFRSKSYLTISGSETLAQGRYGLWNASVSLLSQDEKWQVVVGGKNLTDKEYRNHGFDLSGFPGVELGYYGAPRTYALTGRYNF